MDSPERELLWLRRVRDLAHLLISETDTERLLPRILDAGIELTGAERGMLVLVQERRRDGSLKKIRVEAARGFDRDALQGPENGFSRTVVKRVLDRGDRGLVTTSAEDRDVLGVSSVQARAVLSILCVPLRLRGETHGVLYLDHRQEQLAFTEHDLPILQSFADQAALALETAGRTRPSSTSAIPHALIGESEAIRALHEQLDSCARSWAPVLLLGESGAGKELVAREIHARGDRRDQPFLRLSSAGASGAALLNQLFGVVPASFGAAGQAREGLLVQAGHGAVYIDDIAELDSRAQALLLRSLQEEHVSAIGAADTRPLNCRIFAASRHDLRALVGKGEFREDLYYRLDVMRVGVPPLRRRPEDIPLLVDRFAGLAGRAKLNLSPRALELLCGYSWPGNVRELQNEVQRLAALGLRRLSSQQLSAEIREGRGVPRAEIGMAGKTLGEVERAMVEAAMRDCKGKKAQAARQLGIPRTTLYHLLERYEIG